MIVAGRGAPCAAARRPQSRSPISSPGGRRCTRCAETRSSRFDAGGRETLALRRVRGAARAPPRARRRDGRRRRRGAGAGGLARRRARHAGGRRRAGRRRARRSGGSSRAPWQRRSSCARWRRPGSGRPLDRDVGRAVPGTRRRVPRVALAGRDVLAVAAAADTVVVATADLLWRGRRRRHAARGRRARRAAARARGRSTTCAATSPTTTASWRSVRTASGRRVLDRATRRSPSAAAWCSRSRATAPIAGRRASRRARRRSAAGARARVRRGRGRALRRDRRRPLHVARRRDLARASAGWPGRSRRGRRVGGRMWLAIDDGAAWSRSTATGERAAPSPHARRRSRCAPLATRRLVAPAVPGRRCRSSSRRSGRRCVRLVARRAVRVPAGARGHRGRRPARLAAEWVAARRRAGGRGDAAAPPPRRTPRVAPARRPGERGAAMIRAGVCGSAGHAACAGGTPAPPAAAAPPRRRRGRARAAACCCARSPRAIRPIDALRAAASALALTEPDRARSLVRRAPPGRLAARAAGARRPPPGARPSRSTSDASARDAAGAGRN